MLDSRSGKAGRTGGRSPTRSLASMRSYSTSICLPSFSFNCLDPFSPVFAFFISLSLFSLMPYASRPLPSRIRVSTTSRRSSTALSLISSPPVKIIYFFAYRHPFWIYDFFFFLLALSDAFQRCTRRVSSGCLVRRRP